MEALSHEILGEFLGTMVLIIFGGGVVANVVLKGSKGEGSGWIVITTGWFIAVMMGVFVANSAGSAQADLNPAISFAKFLLNGAYSVPLLFEVIAAEIAGAFVGAIVVWLAYLPHWRPTENSDLKRAVFCTSPAIRHYPSNLLCEIIGTAILVIGVGGIFTNAKPEVVEFGPYLVGILVWGIGLSLGGPTGYAINPARDLGPRLAFALLPIPGKGSTDWAYAWVPIVGPFIGAVLGVCFWRAFF